MIVSSVSITFDFIEWLYAALLGFSGFLVPASLVLLIVYARPPRRSASVLAGAGMLMAVGIVALAITVASSAEPLPLPDIHLQIRLFASNIVSSILLSSSVLVAAVLAALTAIAVARSAKRPSASGRRFGAALPVIGAAVVAAALLGATVSATAYRTRGLHPGNVSRGQEMPAALIASDVPFPTGISVARDGEIFFTDVGTSSVWRVLQGPNGPGEKRRYATIPVPSGGRLFHIALHPNWPASPFVYVTAQYEVDGVMYLRLMRLRGAEISEEMTSLVEKLPTEQPNHSDHYGSALAFCGEYLFMSIGDTDGPGGPEDDDTRRLAQVPTMPQGKILRYRLDGAELRPAGVLNADPPVFAMGFRNVFGMGCDPATNFPVVADNGPIGRDQVRDVLPGSNHEWPYNAERTRLTPPLYSSGETRLGPTGIATRRSNGVREIFFSAVHTSSVYRLTERDGTRSAEVIHETPFATLAMAIGIDNCVYVADETSIWRLEEPGCPRSGG